MKNSLLIAASIASLATSLFNVSEVHSKVPGHNTSPANPKFAGADPDVILDRGKYWVYFTSEDTAKKELYVQSSEDLIHWQKSGPILQMSDVSWIDADGAKDHELWAPGVYHNDKKYYLYFSVGPQNPTPSRIGVAVSNSPEGPFVDSGKPLITGNDKFEAIDAMIFKDPKSGKTYLFCGGSAGAKLKAFELNSDLVSIKHDMPIETPQNFTEGVFFNYLDGKYYCSYSNGRYNDDSYRVCYSVADSLFGEWTYKGVILSTDKVHSGPGHHCLMQSKDKKDWLVFYHRWNRAKADGKMPTGRSVAIDKLSFKKNGDINPVLMQP